MIKWINFLVVFCVSNSALAQTTQTVDTAAIIQFNQDDPFIAAIDSFHFENIFENYSFTTDVERLNIHQFSLDSIPIWSDSIIQLRLAALDAVSPFNLDYNEHTQRLINLYGNNRRYMLSKVLGLSELYFPIFEEELEKNDMPIELKYLPIVESALNNTVRSRAGAVGIWQFMYRTGKYLGLEINSYVDERRDPIKSTRTAVQYLKYLHGLYGNWQLALAAYNAGPGNVNKAIRRAGGSKDFWVVQKFLPKETRNYVPSFIAVNYLMNHAADHNIYPLKPKFTLRHVDTIHVKESVTFDQIAQVLCMNYEDLTFLNPQYKQAFIPKLDKDSNNYVLTLPVQYVGDFINNEQNIYECKAEETEELIHESSISRVEITHRVRKGESVGLIAQRYKVSVRELREWNNIGRKNHIYPGQKLVIYGAKKSVATNSSNKKEETYNGYLYYTIRSGDTLWEIAKLYQGVSADDIMKLNRFNSSKVLKPGMKIKIKST